MRTTSIGLFLVLVLTATGDLGAQPAGGTARFPPAPRRGTGAANGGRAGDADEFGTRGGPSRLKSGKKPPNTLITLELLTVGEGVGLKARQWQEILSKMDVTLTIRNGRPNEKIEITERKAGGTLRTVTVKGMLDNKGRLVFPEQIFTENDAGKLAAWFDELRTFGAQGDPDGRPAWGLTKEQFGVIHAALKRPLAFEPKGHEVGRAVLQFELPREYPLRFGAAAARLLRDRGTAAKVGQALEGLAQGTALAVVLGEQGLSYRPRRLPDGSVELTVGPTEEVGDAWPIGWPLQERPPETAPALFDFKTIDLEDEPLDEILEAAADVIGILILTDRAALEAKGIDLAAVKVSHPRKRTTWIEALKAITFKGKCRHELLLDEAGKPFVWVTPLAAPARRQKD